jgi:hypothetical protein
LLKGIAAANTNPTAVSINGVSPVARGPQTKSSGTNKPEKIAQVIFSLRSRRVISKKMSP